MNERINEQYFHGSARVADTSKSTGCRARQTHHFNTIKLDLRHRTAARARRDAAASRSIAKCTLRDALHPCRAGGVRVCRAAAAQPHHGRAVRAPTFDVQGCDGARRCSTATIIYYFYELKYSRAFAPAPVSFTPHPSPRSDGRHHCGLDSVVARGAGEHPRIPGICVRASRHVATSRVAATAGVAL